jgi:Flp pilus assembly protein TadG
MRFQGNSCTLKSQAKACATGQADPDLHHNLWHRLQPVSERGVSAVQFLVILTPVLLAMIGFAVDLGMMYSSRGELKTAADAMALAAASRLNGTTTSTADATTEAQNTIENASGFGNRYYFHGLPIGQDSGSTSSTVTDPAYYTAAADAVAATGLSGSEVSGPSARHVRVTITGQNRLLFWSFLPVVSDRSITLAASSVAGISAPLCQACGIEPYAIAALDPTDAVNFGFTADTKYSFTYLCTGVQPTLLPGATARVSYILLNRQDDNATLFPDPSTQVFRDIAGGIPGTVNSTQACFRVNNTEVVWPNAVSNACTRNTVAPLVTEALCGLAARFSSTVPDLCTGIPSSDSLYPAYTPDTDTSDHDSYIDYTGNGRRLITIPVVDTVTDSANMTILGFRQFLVIPSQGDTTIAPGDGLGRFVALYAGSVAPVPQGRFDGCQLSAGPGKVVLHQ